MGHGLHCGHRGHEWQLRLLHVRRRSMRHGMVSRHGIARSLTCHNITSSAIRLRLRIGTICQVRRCADLRTTMMGSRGSEGRLRRRPSRHAIAPRHKGLCLGIKCMISIVAARDRVLAFGVMRVHASWQLAKCIWNADLSRVDTWRRRRRRRCRRRRSRRSI